MSTFSRLKPKIILVFGGPGAGKSTQCALIERDFGYSHISADDLIQAEMKKPGSQYGYIIEKHMKEGTIVPDEITCNLIKNVMLNSHTNRFVIDGYPRNKANLEVWRRVVEDKVDLILVLVLDCPDIVCLNRCLQRAGGSRSDDNEDTIRKRILAFHQYSLPVVNHYKAFGLVRTINGNKSRDDVFANICFEVIYDI